MKKMKRTAAVAMSAVMLGSLMTGCGQQTNVATPSSETKKESSAAASSEAKTDTPAPAEEVELIIFGNQYAPLEVGPQYDPIADKIAEDTGVRINCAEIESGSNEADILSTLMASNDLPDIFYCPSQELLDQLIEADMILELSDIWNDTNCPNINGGVEDITNRQNYLNEKNFGDKRYAVYLWGGTGAENQPTVGFYVPWDIYSEVGYPEVNSLDDLVDALEIMVKAHPQTEDGQPVYAAGGWFAEADNWGSWCLDQTTMVLGYINDTPVYTFDVANRNILDKPPVTDPDSAWWQAMKFYFDLNQRGLLDPDCITMKYDQWIEKTNSSQYMMIMPGWETEGIKGKTGLSYVALKPMGDAIVCDWSGELGGEGYVISSSCKYPEKALQLLDYLCSPEGARIAYSGLEGLSWEMVDGKAQARQEYLDDSKTLSTSEMVAKYGQSLGHMVGYLLSAVSPVDHSTFELTYTPEYKANTMTDAEKDALKYYGVNTIREIYTENCKSVMTVQAEYTVNIPQWPDDLQKNMVDLKNYVYRNYMNIIFAKDEADFEAQKQALIEGCKDYNIDGQYQWFKEQFDAAKVVVDPFLGN